MMRRIGWFAATAAAAVLLLSQSGWANAGEQGGAAGAEAASAVAASAGDTDALVADVSALDGLADAFMTDADRLWVVTVRTDDRLHRWSGEDPEEAARWIIATASAVTDEDPIWNVNVQGTAAPGETPASLRKRMEAEGATLVERYEESGTYSYGYASPAFTRVARSGEHALNVQAAAHWHTEREHWRFTLGTPAILIEY